VINTCQKYRVLSINPKYQARKMNPKLMNRANPTWIFRILRFKL